MTSEIEIIIERFKEDPRISPSHVSVFLSLYFLFIKNDRQNPVPIKRAAVMELAKISSRFTYDRNMNDLSAYGYIRYYPSRNKTVLSSLDVLGVAVNGC